MKILITMLISVIVLNASVNPESHSTIKESVSILTKKMEKLLPIKKDIYEIKNVSSLGTQINISMIIFKEKFLPMLTKKEKEKNKDLILAKKITKNLNLRLKENHCLDPKFTEVLEKGITFKYSMYFKNSKKAINIITFTDKSCKTFLELIKAKENNELITSNED